MDTPVELAAYNPRRSFKQIYEEAFDEEITKHPEWYGADADHSLHDLMTAESEHEARQCTSPLVQAVLQTEYQRKEVC